MEKFIPGAYNTQEDLDLKMLADFAKTYPNKFYDINPTSYGTIYDATNTSIDGKPYILELKGRRQDALHYDDCFIEMNKYLNLKKEYNNNPQHPTPLYINFFGNGDTIYIWDLRKQMKGTSYLNWPVSGHTELQDRVGLQWEDGYRYEKQTDGKYKMIKNFN